MNPFDQVFGPVIRQSPRKPHAYSDDTRPAPVDYKGMPAPSYGATGIDALAQYITTLSNVGANAALIEAASDLSQQVQGVIQVQSPVTSGVARCVGQFSRPYDWCHITQGTGNAPVCDKVIGVRFLLGNQPVSAVLPVGRQHYTDVLPATLPGEVLRTPMAMMPPVIYRVHFDRIELQIIPDPVTGAQVTAFVFAMVGRGDTFPQPWNI